MAGGTRDQQFLELLGLDADVMGPLLVAEEHRLANDLVQRNPVQAWHRRRAAVLQPPGRRWPSSRPACRCGPCWHRRRPPAGRTSSATSPAAPRSSRRTIPGPTRPRRRRPGSAGKGRIRPSVLLANDLQVGRRLEGGPKRLARLAWSHGSAGPSSRTAGRQRISHLSACAAGHLPQQPAGQVVAVPAGVGEHDPGIGREPRVQVAGVPSQTRCRMTGLSASSRLPKGSSMIAPSAGLPAIELPTPADRRLPRLPGISKRSIVRRRSLEPAVARTPDHR